ncbi:MAG: type I restriction endonuclease subunit R, partial [Planctomycetia bacterium]|nr:type I restriction endonuclease subunit R [Planctomycetia bacterium]
KYHLFGFTGTPIFAENASGAKLPDMQTTQQAFGEKLHTYTIVDAINDKNVLKFRVDYVRTMQEAQNIQEQKVRDIDRERALSSPKRISQIVQYIRDNFNRMTKRNNWYSLEDRRLKGFNSIFATASIDAAKRYYSEFKKQLQGVPSDQQLKVALIYSFGVNDEETVGLLSEENSDDTTNLDQVSRDFLETAIQDYNRCFGTSYDTSSQQFPNYYKDVSERTKKREIDILIVVNMFLTGFNATTLNTLWVDKNLRLHGLLQAFSRTNRILNSVKTFGNIVCFRNLERQTNESIALFGDKDASGVVLLRKYEDYYYGYDDDTTHVCGYVDLIEDLQNRFPLRCIITGEKSQKEFVKHYGAILRMKNILSAFDTFTGNEILSELNFQDYQSIYLDLYNEFRKQASGDREDINDDLVFEIELIKQVEINIDHILMLIRKYHESHLKDKEIIVAIQKAIDASIELRSKKDLIEDFIARLTPSSDVDKEWNHFVASRKTQELDSIIAELDLNRDNTYQFVKNIFRDGYVQKTGTAITEVIPPVSRFTENGDRTQKREIVLEKLSTFYERYHDIVKDF